MRALLAIMFLVAPVAAGAQPRTQSAPYDVIDTVVLPKGNARAGRQAFQDLKCHLCHGVAGEKEFKPGRTAGTHAERDAPTAVGVRHRSGDYLAFAFTERSDERGRESADVAAGPVTDGATSAVR